MTTIPDTYVHVSIEYLDGEIFGIDCPVSFAGQYVTHGQSVFLEALSRTEGWFTVDDIHGHFHAIPLDQIKSINAHVVSDKQELDPPYQPGFPGFRHPPEETVE